MQTPRRDPQGDHLTSLLIGQQQLLDIVRAVDQKLSSIGEAVGADLSDPLGSSTLDAAGVHSFASWAEAGSERTEDVSFAPPIWTSHATNGNGTGTGLRLRIVPSSPLSQAQSSQRFRGNGVQSLSGLTRNESMEESPPQPATQAWSPDSRSRMLFDVVGVPLLLYDAFLVPYLLAWNVTVSGPSVQVLAWCTRLFWTADLFVGLVTGYRGKDAKLVLDVHQAMRNYLRGWFVPDFTLVCLDWLSIFLDDGETLRRWASAARLVRTVRQLSRKWSLTLKAKLMIPSKTFHLVLELCSLVVIIVWVNHVVCCGWYSMGGLASDTGTTWLSREEYNHSDSYAYWTALHWAMTQMTPGSMEVVPKSSGERIYNVSILLLGLLMGTSLVAMMTSMLTQYKLRVESSSKKFMLLHKFLNQQGVEPKLALAIKMHVKARSSEGQRLRAQDVEYLSLLSNSMQDRLWCSWCRQHITRHQLLSSLVLVDDLAVRDICKQAVVSHEFGIGDAVFEEGALGEDMYFMASGQLLYRSSEDTKLFLEGGEACITLGPGSWCSEASLWTHWVHLGTLEASTSAEVLSVSAPRFMAAIASHPVAQEVVSDYAIAFHQHINDPCVVKTDLSHVVDNCELLSSLSPDTRWALAAPIIEHMERSQFHSFFVGRANLELLKEELKDGYSDIRLMDGEAVRTTSVVAIRVLQADPARRFCRNLDRLWKFLVRIGERNKQTQEVQESVQLPGVKRGWRESYVRCCERLVDEDFQEIKDSLEVLSHDGCRRAVVYKESSSYGIRTRSLRNTFDAHLRTDAELRTIIPSAKPLLATHQSLNFMSSSWGHHKEQQEIIQVLSSQASIIVLNSGTETSRENLYLWLTEHEFEALSKDIAKPLVKQWMNNLVRRRSVRPGLLIEGGPQKHNKEEEVSMGAEENISTSDTLRDSELPRQRVLEQNYRVVQSCPCAL